MAQQLASRNTFRNVFFVNKAERKRVEMLFKTVGYLFCQKYTSYFLWYIVHYRYFFASLWCFSIFFIIHFIEKKSFGKRQYKIDGRWTGMYLWAMFFLICKVTEKSWGGKNSTANMDKNWRNLYKNEDFSGMESQEASRWAYSRLKLN